MKNPSHAWTFSILLPALLAAIACSDPEEPELLVGGGPQGLVVVNSDYKSISVSLVDPATFAVTHDDCINSGTTAPALSLSLSGDVVLPSSSHPEHEVVLVDRTNSALTWIDPATCAVKRQLAVGTGFYSNPNDLLTLSSNKAYVTRYERNEQPTSDPADLDEGEDLLVIDPSAPRILSRIPLGAYATEVNGHKVHARPSRAVLGGDKVYVSLGNHSADFTAAGDGRIVVVDPTTDAVSGTIDLVGLTGCTSLEYESASKTLLVTCGGSFSDGPQQAERSALVAIDVGATPPAIKSTLPAAAVESRPFSAATAVGGQGTLALAVTVGEALGTPPDQLWTGDLSGGTAAKLLDAESSYVYSSVLSDPERSQVFLLDGAMDKPRVHQLDVSGAPALKTSLNANPSRGLPPRAIAWY